MFRSPIAEGIFIADPVAGWRAFSYGTTVENDGHQDKILSSYGKGIQIAIDEMSNIGIDISQKRSQQVLREHVQDADKIIMMSEKEYIPEWLQSYSYEYWEVPNPDSITKRDAEEVIALLQEKIVQLKKKL